MKLHYFSLGVPSIAMQGKRDPFYPLNQSRKNTHHNDSCTNLETSTLLFPPCTKGHIIKNLFVINFGSFLMVWGFEALANLQSSMNSKQGVGTTSLAAMYAACMLSTLLLPTLMIKSIGCKMTLALSLSFEVPYIAANYWSTWGTLIPTAVVYGLTFGCAIPAIATYIHEMARKYGRYVGAVDSTEVIAATFFSVRSFTLANTQIWGNLVSYGVLKPKSAHARNSSAFVDGSCGVNFVSRANETSSGFEKPTDGQHDLLVSIFVASGVLSVLAILIFLDPLDNDKEPLGNCQSVLRSLAAAGKQALRLDQLLLVPVSIYCGLGQAFYTGEFTQAFIACSWGVYHVGYVTVCFGVCGTLMCILVGPLVKMTSQMSVILLAAFILVVTYGLLFTWQPSPDAPALYFVFAGLFGVADVIWMSQIPVLHGLMFPDNHEAAYSNFYFWCAFGFFIHYSCSYYLTVAVKIQIVLIFLLVSVVLYVIGQIKIKCTARPVYIFLDQVD